MRLIGTEEAISFPEISAALNAHCKTNDTSLDMKLVRNIYGDGSDRNAMVARLIDWEDERIAEMDRNGVDMHLLSLTAPGVQLFDPDTGSDLARIANDHMAGIVARRPDRFAGLGTFAPQDPKRAAKEIERCANELKLNGLVINSHTNDLYYDDPFFFPVFEAIEAAGLALYIHPARALEASGRGVRQLWHGYRDVGLWHRDQHQCGADDRLGPVRSLPEAQDRARPYGGGDPLLAVAARLHAP